MNLLLAVAIILPVLSGSPRPEVSTNIPFASVPSIPVTIEAIPLPPGYERMPANINSFSSWLRNVALKKTRTVYLYNGMPKRNQEAQFAVLDISVTPGNSPDGNNYRDLQQCADAVMRLRAEYLFATGRWNEIVFKDNAGRAYSYRSGNDRRAFDKYLLNVFGWCGTASLEKQLKRVACMDEVQPGDVLIKGGFPGHAVIVMDVAFNRRGSKIYLLAQSYMPAQDIHVLRNPIDPQGLPWYEVSGNQSIMTPEWIFYSNQLRRW